MNTVIVKKSKKISGNVRIPGDKSISHRAMIFGALADGESVFEGLLEGEDVLHTIGIFRELGISMTKKRGCWHVKGKGGVLKASKKILYCGNSGTTMRLLIGLLSACPFRSRLTGDVSLNKRPMKRVYEPLLGFGARVCETFQGRKRVIVVDGGALKKMNFVSSVASAQVKTSLLLAAYMSRQPLVLKEPLRSRDHSERLFSAMGVPLSVRGTKIVFKPGRVLQPIRMKIPGDLSSAAFFMVLGLIHPSVTQPLCLENVGLNFTRTGILDILEKMGAKFRIQNRKMIGGEEVGDLWVRHSPLKGVRYPKNIMPRLIDEIPILAVAAACAVGKTRIRGAEELRVKESDRIRVVVEGLRAFGVLVKEYPDGMDIWGTGQLKAARIDSVHDHRIAMAFFVLGTLVDEPSTILGAESIQTSFPEFLSLMRKIGVSFRTP